MIVAVRMDHTFEPAGDAWPGFMLTVIMLVLVAARAVVTAGVDMITMVVGVAHETAFPRWCRALSGLGGAAPAWRSASVATRRTWSSSAT